MYERVPSVCFEPGMHHAPVRWEIVLTTGSTLKYA